MYVITDIFKELSITWRFDIINENNRKYELEFATLIHNLLLDNEMEILKKLYFEVDYEVITVKPTVSECMRVNLKLNNPKIISTYSRNQEITVKQPIYYLTDNNFNSPILTILHLKLVNINIEKL